MFRTQFEKELERVDLLMKRVDDQQELVASTAASIRKIFNDDVIGFKGDLQKLSGATDFGKHLNSCLDLIAQGREQLAKLEKLMSECGEAQDRAKAAMPDYAMFSTDGRLDTVPGRTFFAATKNAGEGTVDPMATLGVTRLSHRRFQK